MTQSNLLNHMPKLLTYLLFTIVPLFIAPNFCYSQLSKKAATAIASEELSRQRRLQLSTAKTIWESKQVNYGDYKLKFEYRILGSKPIDGRSLYISLHGGGNTSPAANDQQWKNQISLYTPKEGIYLAPRAATNTWNLWHEEHIDTMLVEVIKSAILFEGVNPDKIYLLGYSAGGDGVFQLAPRMADHWAAAAMMAGHPGDASAINLKNLPFAIYMGGKDAAYNRNKLATHWNRKLDSLEKQHPGSFKHDVHVYEDMPHWMNRKDTVAIPWLASFKRNSLPKSVSWHQDDVHHNRFYWLGIPKGKAITGAESIVSIAKNVITLQKNENKTLFIYLNDELLNLNRKVKVVSNGKVIFHDKVYRDPAIIKETAVSLDEGKIFSARLTIEGGAVVR